MDSANKNARSLGLSVILLIRTTGVPSCEGGEEQLHCGVYWVTLRVKNRNLQMQIKLVVKKEEKKKKLKKKLK